MLFEPRLNSKGKEKNPKPLRIVEFELWNVSQPTFMTHTNPANVCQILVRGIV